MRKYDKWNTLHNRMGDIILEHFLFGRQAYKCDAIQIINDNEKLGVVIKKKELFVYKQKVVDFCVMGNKYTIGDGALKIIVKIF